MTTWAGSLAGGGGFASFSTSPLPDTAHPLPSYLQQDGDIYVIPSPLGVGSITQNDTYSPKVFSGQLASSCQRNYLYDTLHIVPGRFDLGAIGSDQRPVSDIWNAYLTPVTIQGINSVNGAGISSSIYDGNVQRTLPYILHPLAEAEWRFVVQFALGPATIDSDQTLETTEYGFFGPVVITGQRSHLWGLTHNWTSPFMEQLEWRTSIQTSFNGREHRAALRRAPRIAGELESYLKGEALRKFEHLTSSKQASWLVLPLPQYMAKLSTSIVAGETILQVDDARFRGFEIDQQVMLVEPLSGRAETSTVAFLADSFIELQSGIAGAWPAGTLIHPAGQARIRGSLPLVWQTNEFAAGRVAVDFQPTYTLPSIASSSNGGVDVGNPGPVDIYEGYEVVPIDPDWAGGLSKDLGYESGVIDGLTGMIYAYETHTRQRVSIRYPWLLKDYYQAAVFRAFLARRLGMAKPFWMPTFTSNLRSVPASYPIGETVLRVYDSGFFDYAFNLENRQDIQIELFNGRVFRSKILSANKASASETDLVLETAFPWDVNSAFIRRIGFLTYCRLASDSVTFEWLAPGAARVELTLITVPYPLPMPDLSD